VYSVKGHCVWDLISERIACLDRGHVTGEQGLGACSYAEVYGLVHRHLVPVYVPVWGTVLICEDSKSIQG
jgi:hypothetical protein